MHAGTPRSWRASRLALRRSRRHVLAHANPAETGIGYARGIVVIDQCEANRALYRAIVKAYAYRKEEGWF
jgi:hypothetical protein